MSIIDTKDLSRGAVDVLTERDRQLFVEGFDDGHDDNHDERALPMAAASYALAAGGLARPGIAANVWPFAFKWWKPRGPRENMVRAAALLIAAIDKYDRRWPRG